MEVVLSLETLFSVNRFLLFGVLLLIGLVGGVIAGIYPSKTILFILFPGNLMETRRHRPPLR